MRLDIYPITNTVLNTTPRYDWEFSKVIITIPKDIRGYVYIFKMDGRIHAFISLVIPRYYGGI